MKKIAVFASGEGTNTQKIIEHFHGKGAAVSLIVCGNPQAGVIRAARSGNIPLLLVEKNSFYNSESVLKKIVSEKIDWIVLAGFFWLIPQNILRAFPNRIINIHPALLPKFGGKGMYGMNVHKAVIGAKEKESGISIHYVNEKYDEGKIILQKKCTVGENDTAETLAEKVRTLEHEWYPKVIEELITKS